MQLLSRYRLLGSGQSRRSLYNVFLSNQVLRNRRAAVLRHSNRGDFPLTYEQKQYPENIGYTKYWNSQNTSNLLDVLRNIAPRKIYFLLGYTETLLSYLLKCPVRMDLQTVENKDELVFRYW